MEDISIKHKTCYIDIFVLRNLFHLSENIGYVPEGIQLIYNQYEVASYADGPIVL
ncbi:MAG: DUF3298 domain-containing protein, partial [Bacteroidota bacterium]